VRELVVEPLQGRHIAEPRPAPFSNVADLDRVVNPVRANQVLEVRDRERAVVHSILAVHEAVERAGIEAHRF